MTRRGKASMGFKVLLMMNEYVCSKNLQRKDIRIMNKKFVTIAVYFLIWNLFVDANTPK